ncbi:N-acetylmuramoyl-L-alanine amidase [Streptomyces sp. 5-8]|uniref:N-acetylmuramoyl-L-alanine amidase n=1 Tax=Streptomyces musisoli TaxID=2802280 RepID=A0ABS1P4P4_9ACTN|nr:N-acetylmuramoyl-L-alanine amidase [Streptomyces musisoli]MBL1107343.1 N-acetylmuramoyl-L-alanine amidase [Streptomyces musisoli]
MAPPLTHDQWLTILRAEGVTVAEYPGWRTRQRDDETGKPFGPVHMFVNHHTGGRDARDVVARDGVPGLPAPLAHVYLARSGVATMCSAGRANHAGLMAVNAYNSFLNEESSHPAPSAASGTVDGNDVAYGIETENRGDGTDVYPREQYDAWVRINAAVCRHHGWSAASVGCHKETSIEGKIDPRGPVEGYGDRGRFEFTPAQFRADVAERLTHPASWSPGSTTSPPKQEETGMDLNDRVLLGDWVPKAWPDDKGLADKQITINTALGGGYAYARRAAETTGALLTEVRALRAEVAQLRAAMTKGT